MSAPVRGFPLDLGAGRPSDLVGDHERHRRALTQLLSTRPGDVPAHPTFGCRALEWRFSAATPGGLRLAEAAVREAVAKWLPGIELLTVAGSCEPGGQLKLELIWRAKNSDRGQPYTWRPGGAL